MCGPVLDVDQRRRRFDEDADATGITSNAKRSGSTGGSGSSLCCCLVATLCAFNNQNSNIRLVISSPPFAAERSVRRHLPSSSAGILHFDAGCSARQIEQTCARKHFEPRVQRERAAELNPLQMYLGTASSVCECLRSTPIPWKGQFASNPT